MLGVHKSFRRYVAKLLAVTSLSLFSTVSYSAQVDVLVLYNTDTSNYYNGSPNTAIRNMVDQANTYYENSRVDIQLRLVGTDLIDLGDNASVLY